MARAIGVLIALVVIIALLPFTHVTNGIFYGFFMGGLTLVLLGTFWLQYHVRKLAAIKSAARN